MAESFLYSVPENIMGKIASLALQEVSLAWGLERDLKKLEDNLTIIKAVLLDAEEKQAHSQALRLWLGRLKNFCYDAEDVLDELEYEGLRKQVVKQYGHTKKKVTRCRCPNLQSLNSLRNLYRGLLQWDPEKQSKVKINLSPTLGVRRSLAARVVRCYYYETEEKTLTETRILGEKEVDRPPLELADSKRVAADAIRRVEMVVNEMEGFRTPVADAKAGEHKANMGELVALEKLEAADRQRREMNVTILTF
ncbi:putative disease resistance RPP13-like protein 1 [Tripterygium wilfordii]|uniref:putative disease resistance RPP13-like protein 1 n=1 Tax=Tripterygium wilfordii TaxID=458696 RepID=UPI0018F80DBE|nr:putative disease resistance RPP13-like protein 1 [Tripterygium wilfordii]